MKLDKRKNIDNEKIKDAKDWTRLRKYFIRDMKDKVAKMTLDVDREQRIKRHECIYCYYADSKIGGAAMTYSDCQICGKKILNGSTCTDRVCEECAKDNNLCRHCGAELFERWEK